MNQSHHLIQQQQQQQQPQQQQQQQHVLIQNQHMNGGVGYNHPQMVVQQQQQQHHHQHIQQQHLQPQQTTTMNINLPTTYLTPSQISHTISNATVAIQQQLQYQNPNIMQQSQQQYHLQHGNSNTISPSTASLQLNSASNSPGHMLIQQHSINSNNYISGVASGGNVIVSASNNQSKAFASFLKG